MGGFLSTIHEAFMGFYGIKARILMLGLDAAGKTTILYRLKLNETVTTIPTIGFNLETLQPMSNVTFTVWDVCSGTKVRPLWKHYFANTDGLLFVVDSADLERFEEAREELNIILNNNEMRGVPVVILANKQDLSGALTTSEMVERLRLQKWIGLEWHVQGCVATIGEGLVEGMQKMSEMVKERRKARRFWVPSRRARTKLSP